MRLLERDGLLAQLQTLLQRAAAGQGSLALIEGEAGIGKSALLKCFALAQPPALPVLWGACDALQTPQPLAPLRDIAARSGGELPQLLDGDADRGRVFAAVLRLLGAGPALVIVEDLHWADDATLDLLRYLGRRMADTPSLLVASCRDDELGGAHPLRLLLGDLTSAGITRFTLPPLSVHAVQRLVGERGVDAAALHGRTGGNPFFVTEVLAIGGGDTIPASVRDAVHARAARLRPSARAVLDAVAVAGPRVEPGLLADVAGAEVDAIDDCRAAGVLAVDAEGVVFRHELARQAVLEALTPTRRRALHRLVLQALLAPNAPPADAARLAHHAEAAGLGEAVLQWAPAAARLAAALGAHRQAAAQFARALRFAPPQPAPRARLLDELATENQLTGALDEAIDARRAAAALWRQAGHTENQALSLTRLAHALVVAGRNAEGEAALRQGIELAGRDAATPAAVAIWRWSAYLRMLDRDVDEAVAEGELAMAAAERLGDAETVLQCLNTIGSSLIVAGQVELGRARLESSLALAERAQLDFHIANALGNLGSALGEAYHFEPAEHYLRRGIAFCRDRDLDNSRLYDLSWLAMVQLYRGQWPQASQAAHEVLGDRASPGIARIVALLALGRLRSRRGDPGVWALLDEARDLAESTATLQRIAPMRTARAEAAWLEGDGVAAAREAGAGVALAVRKRHAWFASELIFWAGLAGTTAPIRPDFCVDLPFTLEADGRWQHAAAAWRGLGCPFETARALAGGDVPAQREALAILESLGAAPMIERVRRGLRVAGVRGLPRGPRASTLDNPAGLTGKEIQVLVLLAQGLRSREIGERLSRSTRTIDHHLAAIFVKLEVATRAEAVSAAHRLGLIAPLA